jgi:hypothetical protein
MVARNVGDLGSGLHRIEDDGETRRQSVSQGSCNLARVRRVSHADPLQRPPGFARPSFPHLDLEPTQEVPQHLIFALAVFRVAGLAEESAKFVRAHTVLGELHDLGQVLAV